MWDDPGTIVEDVLVVRPCSPCRPGRSVVTMTHLSEKDLDRQRQIWVNLYGPARTATLLAAAVQHAARHPDQDAAAVFRAVDPDDEDTYTHFVATRW